MTIQDTIKKAYGAGYQFPKHYGKILVEFKNELEEGFMESYNIAMHEIFLDPDFWKCLGKAMGWDDYHYIGYDQKLGAMVADERIGVDEWQFQWHKLIDHLAEGKSIESYFEEL